MASVKHVEIAETFKYLLSLQHLLVFPTISPSLKLAHLSPFLEACSRQHDILPKISYYPEPVNMLVWQKVLCRSNQVRNVKIILDYLG